MAEFEKKILIVDDNEINRILLCEMLQGDFELLEAENGLEAITLLKQRSEEIGLILLDAVMPEMDGFGVLGEMRARRWFQDIQVIMISAEDAPQLMRRAFDLGAVDFISRPFDQSIVYRRIVNTIKLFAKQKELTDMLAQQMQQQERNNRLMVSLLSHIVEFRNGESGQHVQNINEITELLLDRLLSKTDRYQEIAGDVSIIKMASSLHDIGKIGISEAILNKPGKLTPEEFEQVKAHTLLGAHTMQQLSQYQKEPLVQYSYQICRWHHERWDGRGYPDGLAGDEIPVAAQVVSLADVYDALTSVRCYKEAFSHQKAMEMIIGNECGVFNPLLIECLQDIEDVLRDRVEQQKKRGVNTEDLDAAAAALIPRKELAGQQHIDRFLQQQMIFFQNTEENWLAYDNESDVVSFNAAAQIALGLPQASFTGVRSLLRDHCEESERNALLNCYYGTVPEQPEINCELTLRLSSGSRRLHVCGSAIWFSANEKPRQRAGVLLRLTDVTC